MPILFVQGATATSLASGRSSHCQDVGRRGGPGCENFAGVRHDGRSLACAPLRMAVPLHAVLVRELDRPATVVYNSPVSKPSWGPCRALGKLRLSGDIIDPRYWSWLDIPSSKHRGWHQTRGRPCEHYVRVGLSTWRADRVKQAILDYRGPSQRQMPTVDLRDTGCALAAARPTSVWGVRNERSRGSVAGHLRRLLPPCGGLSPVSSGISILRIQESSGKAPSTEGHTLPGDFP